MKDYMLWLLVLLVLIQAYTAIQTSPEFHVLTRDEYLKEIQANSNLTAPPKGIGQLETNEYFNGRRGKYLVSFTLATDIAMLFLLILTIRENRHTFKDSSGDKNRYLS